MKNRVVKYRGTLEFSPVDVTKKHISQSTWKCVAILKTGCDLDEYYSWFLKRRFNLQLNRNLRGSHITFINDRMEKSVFNEGLNFYNGKECDFYLDINPLSNGKHWWFRAYSSNLEAIRMSLGLSPDPYLGLHFTLGHANEKNIEHSKYIWEQCVSFGLVDLSKRILTSEIVDFI
jgi:hypothetical protein